MPTKGYYLGNVDDLSIKHPNSFFAPCPKLRGSLKAGQMVKLAFIPEKLMPGRIGGERMWVQISLTHPRKKTYIGKLVNHPATMKEIVYGDTVTFGPENVYDIFEGAQ